ncbi:uracil phosphoribosyltransferase [Aspergillus aculeatinus CBS 121060]|uniref:uracil phosphoribosyltransferase n=3 Tax=Aspergillus TaxID=5052 RepID=A0A8G1RUS9_9EURO|nr:uracil phosphoribosyltransferase furA [Aspergillus brunneoviolaceus CBS 621.78]XP_025501471.1 uracil phosphoribosyltransferase furA [Aspergillus aculeatinus CBS 121060]XP_040803284.1 uracil phosphoribosyltransferase furA [Aspergillus fijiensis CBS 313.89]RAH49837.1 uracil phosphoribosyltransferase furA [Aspergillus brunneoviolaceus CBS 621.78]RAH67648.1 uracil phosphoribosyltransferase furA [Aspergillus aculeatinus CBS 121060]RAK79274.1 uracil phosphoribosyltransferase furA [Aspergillus fij
MSLPSNVHVSSHPLLQAKLSQLRSSSTSTRQTRDLVHEIATILGVEAFASGWKTKQDGTDKTPLGIEYPTTTLDPSNIALVPILRSGLGMTDAINSLLPTSIPIYHLGLFRERLTLQPVEYYNNLPFHKAAGSANPAAAETAILLDPIIATGATAEAAIQLLREWGVRRVVMLSVLGSEAGIRRAAGTWADGVEVWTGAVDAQCDERGMIVPGLGDIGDRLFVAIGK